MGEIEEHVEVALAEAGDDEAAVRNVMERLGQPEEIAAAAGARPERGGSSRPRCSCSPSASSSPASAI